MEGADDDQWMDVPERPSEDPRIQVPVDGERTSDDPNSWAEVVENSSTSHMAEAARPAYPAHLSSEVSSFDGILPQQGLGELSHAEQLRLFRLNGVPNRPCSARFSLPDNSIDSKTLLDKIVSMGIPKSYVSCIQRFRTGQVDVTFTSTQDRELFLSKVALAINQRPATIQQQQH